MSSRIKVAVVAGNLSQPRLLNMFEALADESDVSLYAIEGDKLLRSYNSSLKLHVFENLKDMPGYLRSLEEQISAADILVALETSQLATFQTVRIAAKTSRPVIVLTHEFHPYFYVNYPNIRAIQVDIMEHATKFWPSSKSAESLLKMEGVAPDKITMIKPGVDTKRFAPSDKGREKFRRYIGIEDHETLLLYNEDLDASNRPLEVLHALKLLNSTSPKIAARLRLIFVGNGDSAQDLKYRSYDYNLGKKVLFLHQDTEPFLRDLYAASDVVISPRKLPRDFHESFPLHLLEAMSCGAVPLVSVGTVAAECTGSIGLALSNDTFQGIAEGLRKLLSEHFSLADEKQRAVDHIQEHFSLQNVGKLMKPAIADILKDKAGLAPTRHFTTEGVSGIVELIKQNQFDEALVRIEALLLMTIGKSSKSEILRLRGDVLYHLSRLDEAMESYSECLRMNAEDFEAYRGLGYISLKGHSHEEALTFFKKALAKSDDDMLSLLGIAMVHRRLGLSEEALFWQEKAVELHRDHPKVLTSYVQTCMECATTGAPIASLKKLIDNVGEEPTLVATLGQLYLREGNDKLGNELLEKAKKLQGAKVAA